MTRLSFEKCHMSAIFFRHVGMTFLYDDKNFFRAMLCQEIFCPHAPLKNFVKLAGLLEWLKLHFLATMRPSNSVYLLYFTEVIHIGFGVFTDVRKSYMKFKNGCHFDMCDSVTL